MQAAEILEELEQLGSPSIKKVLMNHGAREPFYGVKVEDLKKIQKRLKKNHQLALDLYATGVSDAMYLAGLIADESQMSKKDLQRWADQAYWYMLGEYTVAWVASESRFGRELALKWIESRKESIAAIGWATLSSLVAVKADEELDLNELTELLQRVAKTIHAQPNRVRHTMNHFVIAVGSYVEPLSPMAVDVAKKIGKVDVDMGGTACKVPLATEYIEKVRAKKGIGKKRKSARC